MKKIIITNEPRRNAILVALSSTFDKLDYPIYVVPHQIYIEI
jgi:hypothetical protein